MSGSVTATICITPWSSSFWTRWRTAASERPTALPIAAYGRMAVFLELFDDGEGDGVQLGIAVPLICASTGHDLTVHDVSTVPQG